MSRLDELYEMRDRIDAEIQRELDALKTTGVLRDEVVELLGTARTATVRVLAAVSQAYGVPIETLTTKGRNRTTVDARHIAAWLLNDHGYTSVEVGRTFDQDHSTALHAVARVNRTPPLLAVAHSIRDALHGPTTRPAQEVA